MIMVHGLDKNGACSAPCLGYIPSGPPKMHLFPGRPPTPSLPTTISATHLHTFLPALSNKIELGKKPNL